MGAIALVEFLRTPIATQAQSLGMCSLNLGPRLVAYAIGLELGLPG